MDEQRDSPSIRVMGLDEFDEEAVRSSKGISQDSTRIIQAYEA